MLTYQAREVATPSGLQRVCVVEVRPERPSRSASRSTVAAWASSAWIDHVLRERPQAVLLSPMRLDPRLDDDELEALAYEIASAQLDAWQPVLDLGIRIGRVGLRVRELHVLRCAAQRLTGEREHAGRERDAIAVRELVLYFGAGLETVLEQLLPLRLSQRRPARTVAPSALRELARIGA